MLTGLFRNLEGDYWLSTSEGRFYDILFTKRNDTLTKYKGGPFNLLPDVRLMHISSIENKTWIAKSKTIYIVDKEKLDMAPPAVSTLLTRIVIRSGGTDSTVMNESFYSVDEKGRRYPVAKLPKIIFRNSGILTILRHSTGQHPI